MVSTQSRRLPIQHHANQAAANRAAEVLSSKGVGLPCKIVSVNDHTVTIAFTVADVVLPNMTLPVAEPLYSRAPYQVGDRGVVLPADAPLHEASGQATQQPNFQGCGNLGALFFFPISNTTWAATPSKNMYLIQGPSGFLLRSLDGAVSVIGTKGQNLALTYGSSNITLTGGSITLDAPEVIVTGNLTVANGLTGTFMDQNGSILTYISGIAVNGTDLA